MDPTKRCFFFGRPLLFQLFLEGITSRQMQDTLLIDKYIMEKDIQQGSASASFLSKRSSRIEDQVYLCVTVYSDCKPPFYETLTLEGVFSCS